MVKFAKVSQVRKRPKYSFKISINIARMQNYHDLTISDGDVNDVGDVDDVGDVNDDELID